MSTIPLVALSVRPTATPQDLQAQQMQLKNLAGQNAMIPGQLQEQQQQLEAGGIQNKSAQLALQDQMTMRQLAQKYLQRDSNGNVTGFDFQGFANEAQGKGIDPASIQQIQLAHAQAVKSYADAGEATLANEQAHNKAAFEVIEGIKPITDPAKRQVAYQQGLTKLQGMGVDTSTLPQQVPDNDTLTDHEATLGMHQQILDDAKKVADINKSQSDEFKEVPGTGIFFNPISGESKLATGGPTLSPQMMEAKYVQVQQAMKLGQPVSAEDKAFASSYEKMKTLVPAFNFNLQGGQGGGLTGTALDQAAQRYAQTGVLPSMGMGAAGAQARKAIMNRAGELFPSGSITANSAEYKANQNSLASLQKNFDQVTAFENTAGKNLDQFLSTAKNVIDAGSPWINRPLRSVDAGALGSQDQAAFNAARVTALTEIAKVLNSSNASGVLSDSARSEVSQLIGPNATLKQIVSAANILKNDMANRHDAYQEQIGDIKSRLGGAQGGGPAQAGAPSNSGTTRIKASDGSLHDIPTANLDKARQIDPKLQVIQ